MHTQPNSYASEHNTRNWPCFAALILVGALTLVGITQFAPMPFDNEPHYEVTLRDGFKR